MSDWTSSCTIYKDITLAQGRKVPASLKATSGDEPPALDFTEETEEEFYKDYIIGNVDYQSGPDIRLIQEMLSLVQSQEPSDLSAEDQANQVVVISKLKPTAPDFVPSDKMQTGRKQTKTTKQVDKKDQVYHKVHTWKKNVAMLSIMDAKKQSSEDSHLNPEPVKTEVPVMPKKSQVHPILLPTMFKRKTIENTQVKETKPSARAANDHISTYKPSALAKDYYNQFEERSKIKLIQGDIWTRLEKEMKRIDEKRKQEAVASSSSSSVTFDDAVTSSPIGSDYVEWVTLEQHRHLLDAKCVVCEMAQKHGYDIQEVIPEDSPAMVATPTAEHNGLHEECPEVNLIEL